MLKIEYDILKKDTAKVSEHYIVVISKIIVKNGADASFLTQIALHMVWSISRKLCTLWVMW
jgi:hypothetical protein